MLPKEELKGVNFLPDPWTYSENAYPNELNLFLVCQDIMPKIMYSF